MDPYSTAILWIVIVGFLVAFVLAFGIGANDVANSFGTSVGSGVLNIRQACILATICECLGAVLIGYKVSDTMRKGILDVEMYTGAEVELMLGCLSALASSAIWLLLATYFKIPISGTHSIVGSTIGFSLVARGTAGLKWGALGTIIASWFISPVMSGLVSTILFWGIRKWILNARSPLKAGLFALPIFYGITFSINIFSIFHDGPKLLYMDNIPTWVAIVSSIACGLVLMIIVQLFVVPIQRKKVLASKTNKPVTFQLVDSTDSTPNGSPKRNRRPMSVIVDGKSLPSITETTELVSLNNRLTPNGYCDPTLLKRFDFSDLTPQSNGKYKIDPKIIESAEHLLGKASLDNTDLTITSLNYIDEQQVVGRNFTGFFDRQSHRKSIESDQMKSPSTKSDVTIPISDLTCPVIYSKNGKTVPKTDQSDIVDRMSTTLSPNSSKVPLITKPDELINTEEPEDISTLFSFLQILTATFGSFAHGGNDVSNAIGPLIAVWMIYTEGTVLQQSETPLLILLYGGIGISIGLWLWGRRVIETVGNDLTKITPSTGFTIEIGAATTVLLASKIGLPISTTHCKVGSVVFVGYASAKKSTPEEIASGNPQPSAVDWGLFRNIVYAWVVTVPAAVLLSAGIMFVISKLVL